MLRLGKIKESIFKRSVLRQFHNEDNGILDYGKEAGILPISVGAGAVCVSINLEPIQGWTLAAHRAVYRAVHRFFAAGGNLEAIAVTILMPEGTEESQLRKLMDELARCCKKEHISLRVGYSAVSKNVNTLFLSVTGIGLMSEEAARQGDGRLLPDQSLVAVGSVAREGAAILACRYEEKLVDRFASFYVDIAKKLYDDASMMKAREVLEAWKDARIFALKEGGIFAGLWELAAAGKVGLDIDLKTIPIRQHTIEVCELFNLNPYMLLSGGSFLVVVKDGEALVSALCAVGIEAAVIGTTTSGKDRIIRYDDEIRYLEPPKTDEIYLCQDD